MKKSQNIKNGKNKSSFNALREREIALKIRIRKAYCLAEVESIKKEEKLLNQILQKSERDNKEK